jgi:N4-gp56 family major capsid protein
MAINTTVVSNTIQPKYSKKLLDRAVQVTRLIDYGTKGQLEAHMGATSVTFFQPPEADLSATGAPATLTEGTAPSNDRDFSFTPINVPLVQIGQKGRITDVATTVGLIKFLDTMIELFGDEFALDVDTRIRNVLCHATTGLTKRYAQALVDHDALKAATLANGKLIPRDLLDAKTRLFVNRAPTIGGDYVAIVPPQGTRDLLNDAEFREVVRNNNAEKIFKGEIGTYYGLRVAEATNPFQEDETEGAFATSFSGAGTNTTGLIYSTIVTGKGAYGVVDMPKLGGVAKKPQIIILDQPDKTDPLGQYVSVAWKAYWANKVLRQSWGITLRHKTQFAG